MGDLGQEMASEIRRVATRLFDAARTDREGHIDRAQLLRLADLGLFGACVPEQYGGIGLGLREATAIVAELARHDRSVAVSLGLHLGLGTRALVEFGGEELKETWLPRLAAGDVIASFAATEPAAGSDLTSITTTATLATDEDVLILRGEKAYVTNGGFAGCFTVLAKTPGFGGARGTSLLFVPREAAGLSVGAEENKLGIRGSSTVSVFFDDVRVPRSHVLGEPGRGMDAAHRALEWGRTIMSAGCVGTARTALEKTAAHTQARTQFGRTLIRHGGVRAHLATMASLLYASEAAVAHVGALDEEGSKIGIASAMTKVLASEAAFEITDRAIQLHGALGVIEDAGVAMLARDCRVTRIFEGANDVLVLHLGSALVASSDVTLRAHATTSPRTLASAAWERTAARLDDALTIARLRYGVGVVRHPVLVQRLGQAAVWLYGASAALRRAALVPSDTTRASHAVRELLGRTEAVLASLADVEDGERTDDALVDALFREAPIVAALQAPEGHL